jgi:hypothetical protein
LRRALALAVLGLASSVAVAIEEPAYEVIESVGAFELRRYAPYLVAETRVDAGFEAAGNIAFNRLFGYISGNNRARIEIAMTAPVTQEPARGEKIAMTAPVSQEAAEGGGFRVGFIVPSKYTTDTVPQPVDPAVYIRSVPGRLVASWRYSGRWTESSYREKERLLREAIAARGLTAAGEPIIARYNAPFVPWPLRRNEVIIPVTRPD